MEATVAGAVREQQEQMRVEGGPAADVGEALQGAKCSEPLLCLSPCLSAWRGQYLSEWVKHKQPWSRLRSPCPRHPTMPGTQ